ncbi:hypothetical protein ACLOJK_020260 [Asimina triloba]
MDPRRGIDFDTSTSDIWKQVGRVVKILAWKNTAVEYCSRTDNAIKNHWNSSVKKKLDSYIASGSLAQFQGVPLVKNPDQRVPSSAERKQQNSAGCVLKDGIEIEESSDRSQGSSSVGCSQSYDVSAAVSVHADKQFKMREKSLQKIVENTYSLGTQQPSSPLKESITCTVPETTLNVPTLVNASEQRVLCEAATESRFSQKSSHELLDAVQDSSILPEPLKYCTSVAGNDERNTPTRKAAINPKELVDEALPLEDNYTFNELLEEGSNAIDLVGYSCVSYCQSEIQRSEATMSLASHSLIRQPHIEDSEVARNSALCSDLCYSVASPDIVGDHFFQNIVTPNGNCLQNGECILGSEVTKVTDGTNATPGHRLPPYSDFLFDSYNFMESRHVDDVGKPYMPVEVDQKNETSRPTSIEVLDPAMRNPSCGVTCMDGRATGPIENLDSEPLFYEPPCFPSLDIPFLSCDLISSGEEEYSPLGIRRLMMSCSPPSALWDSPSQKDSPDAVLKSAAKSFLFTPSILKKRPRKLLSPTEERKNEKNPGMEMDHGCFFISSTTQRSDCHFCPSLGTRSDENGPSFPSTTGAPPVHPKKPSPVEKENLNQASKGKSIETVLQVFEDNQQQSAFCFNASKDDEDTIAQTVMQNTSFGGPFMAYSLLNTPQGKFSRMKEVPGGVLVEHNLNNLQFSPLQNGCLIKRPLVNDSKSPGTHFNKSLEITSKQVDVNSYSQSSSGNPCHSDFLSPNVHKRMHGPNLIPQALQITSERVGAFGNTDIENSTLSSETPGIKKGIESPSAWKSPWFMHSLFPGPRFDTEFTFEDIGYFLSPGARTYDAIGLMRQLNEHTADALAEAQEILAAGVTEVAAASHENERSLGNTHISEVNKQFQGNELDNLITSPPDALYGGKESGWSGKYTKLLKPVILFDERLPLAMSIGYPAKESVRNQVNSSE